MHRTVALAIAAAIAAAASRAVIAGDRESGDRAFRAADPVAAAARGDSSRGAAADSTRPDPAGAARRSTRPAAEAPADSVALPWQLEPVATVVAAAAGGARMDPVGLAADAFGRIFVVDAAGHSLRRYDAAGRLLAQAGALGSSSGELRRPGSVALLGTLRVAVLDTENRRVVAYDLFDRLQGTFVDLAALEEELGRVDPVALATDRGGALFVADRDRDRVLVFDFAGSWVRTLGGFGEAPGSFRRLSDVATTPRGDLIVSERTGARIQRLDPAGTPLAAWTLEVAGEGSLAVAADSSRIAVADEALGAVWLFDASGRTLARATGLARPRSLAFAPDGTLLVGESAAGRVRRFAIRPAGPPNGE